MTLLRKRVGRKIDKSGSALHVGNNTNIPVVYRTVAEAAVRTITAHSDVLWIHVPTRGIAGNIFRSVSSQLT